MKPGRPLDKTIQVKILDAAAEILKTQGFSALTMDKVAKRSGVAKHSVYRRYSSPVEIAVALLQKLSSEKVSIPNTGSLASDLELIMKDVRSLFENTPFAPVLATLVSAAVIQPELARLARSYLTDRRKGMAVVVERAIDRGELPKSTEPLDFLELHLAPLYYRYLISGQTVNDGFINLIIGSLRQNS